MDSIEYKYSEDEILDEIRHYIDSTYEGHYSRNRFQATEFILDSGHGAGFCIGNIMKYAQRYGKKGNQEDWKNDLMKVIHYAIIALHNYEIQRTIDYAEKVIQKMEEVNAIENIS